MRLKLALALAALTIGSAVASANGISYTCDPTVSAATCTFLNTTVAGFYNTTFSNANADIYITYGTTDLGQSSQFQNFVTYSSYVNALSAQNGPGAIRADALASLPGTEPAIYNSGNINLTTALAAALGITTDAFGNPITGTTVGGSACTNPGSGGCYDAVITLTNSPNTFYDRNGPQPAGTYDLYTTVEHETDEVLGTASCIDTTGPSLSNGCGGNDASAVDLFRYSSPGTRVFQDGTPGAYFSYDGGVTNGANGNIYSTLSNGEDYADFLSNCPAGPLSVQDAEGCPDTSGLDITNDGGAENNILDAVGYNLNLPVTAVPEPSAIYLFGASIGILAVFYRRRRLGSKSL